LDTVVTILLQGAFYAVFAAVVARYLRRRSQLNRDVVLAFGSVAGLFLLTIASSLIPGSDPLQTISSVLLVAQPFLTVRLVGHFGRVAAPLVVLALVGFLVAAGLVIIGITGNRPALLYVVALHRFLRWRVPDYSAERHLAGVLYLFVRGMTGPETPLVDGMPCGVFAWRPSGALVEALSDAFDRGTAP